MKKTRTTSAHFIFILQCAQPNMTVDVISVVVAGVAVVLPGAVSGVVPGFVD